MALFQACLLICICVTTGKTSTITKESPTDFKTKPNIFTPKSILRPQYGVLYGNIRHLYQELQWYYLVIGIPLPTERGIPDVYSDVTINCDYHTHSEHDQMPVRDLMQMCVNFFSASLKSQQYWRRWNNSWGTKYIVTCLHCYQILWWISILKLQDRCIFLHVLT